MPGFHLSSHSVATLLCCCVTAIAGRLPSYLQSKMGDKRKLCALLSNPWLCGGKNDRRTERQVRLFLSFLRELSTGRSRFYRSDLPASLPMPPSPTHRLTMYKINRQAKFQARHDQETEEEIKKGTEKVNILDTQSRSRTRGLGDALATLLQLVYKNKNTAVGPECAILLRAIT